MNTVTKYRYIALAAIIHNGQRIAAEGKIELTEAEANKLSLYVKPDPEAVIQAAADKAKAEEELAAEAKAAAEAQAEIETKAKTAQEAQAKADQEAAEAKAKVEKEDQEQAGTTAENDPEPVKTTAPETKKAGKK